MSSLSAVGCSAAARKNDRASLCSFTFSDGRRCRTPRAGKHPHFCFYHAQKEARARAAEKLGKDLAYFFSGDYLSACDLSTALSRLIPAVVRGDVKPRTARTVAYLAQTLMQAIHISQDEYINAFDTDGWRKAIRNSVNSNHDYLFPPKREPHQPQPQSQQPGPSSRAPMPRTSAEFVQHVVAGLQTGQKSSPPAPQPSTTPPQAQQPASTPPSNPPQPAAPNAGGLNVAAGLQPGSLQAPPTTVIPNPVASFANGGEGPASFSSSPTPAPPRAPSPIPSQAPPTTVIPNPVASFANGGEGPASYPIPAPPRAPSPIPSASRSHHCHPEPSRVFCEWG